MCYAITGEDVISKMQMRLIADFFEGAAHQSLVAFRVQTLRILSRR